MVKIEKCVHEPYWLDSNSEIQILKAWLISKSLRTELGKVKQKQLVELKSFM